MDGEARTRGTSGEHRLTIRPPYTNLLRRTDSCKGDGRGRARAGGGQAGVAASHSVTRHAEEMYWRHVSREMQRMGGTGSRRVQP
mmetsp:Transcript_8463/g.27253  ORF Transcript_8463/g.27253 Transcript_8463/m.27253 type:complete len:85 (+) Transcript_8463:41-295(+)|eukprot:scaffold24859_cov129-Isochrysis_galbana.AAC.2